MRRLLRKTELNEIHWETTTQPGVFQCAFPEYSIRIGIFKNPYKAGGLDDYVLLIFDSEGNTLEEVRAPKFPLLPEGEPLQVLHSLARRSALGADKAIDAILSALE